MDLTRGFWSSLWTVFVSLSPEIDIGCSKTFWVFYRKISVITYRKNKNYKDVQGVFIFIKFDVHNWAM